MTGYRQLAERVAAAGGLMHVSVEELRDLEGAGKLGTHVRESIERNLSRVELKLLERRIPNDQRELVWLIAPQTDYGWIIWEAVIEIRRMRTTSEAA